MSMQPLPAYYTIEIAKQRMADLERSSALHARSKRRTRRALAGGLRKLADWIEPRLAMRVPAQRRPA
jgi:hypothetical protein